jgi:homoserine dehydrogenase
MNHALLALPTTAPERSVRTIRVALAGCGAVGGQFLALLRAQSASIAAARGIRAEITRVLVRSTDLPRAVPLPPHILTADVESFLRSPADVVVEAIGGIDPALRIAHAAIATGRGFITANKALVAEHGAALEQLAARHAAGLRFEAAVAGGVPVIRVLRDAIAHDEVRSIAGILNGTTNYILTRMETGASFAAALADAQANGFAEADPSRDLDGRDSADKIRILAWLAFGTSPSTLLPERRGLLPAPDALTSAAAAAGGAVRLIAETTRLDGGVSAVVEPVLVSGSSEFARTAAQDNLILVDSAWTGRLALAGAGAGGRPTASSLLADLLDATPRPPRRDAASTPLRGVADPRAFRWLIATTAPPPQARDFSAGERIGMEDVLPHAFDRRTHVLTEPCTRARVDALLRRIHHAGFAADWLRCELKQ